MLLPIPSKEIKVNYANYIPKSRAELKAWFDKMSSKNGFGVLSKMDQRIIRGLFEQEMKALRREDDDD